MTKDDKAFIRDNKERLEDMFRRMYEIQKERILTLPQGQERDIQIEFVKFLNDWLYTIDVFSRPEERQEETLV